MVQKKLFDPTNKAVKFPNQKLLEELQSTTKATEELDESNVHVKL